MKIVTKSEQKITTVKKTIYVARDGKEFDLEFYCRQYEDRLDRKEALEREDVVVNKALEGQPPLGWEGEWDYSYIWVKPLTEDAVNALSHCYQSEYSEDRFEVGKWMCIELDFDDNCDLCSEDTMKKRVEEQLKSLGYDISITKAKGE